MTTRRAADDLSAPFALAVLLHDATAALLTVGRIATARPKGGVYTAENRLEDIRVTVEEVLERLQPPRTS